MIGRLNIVVALIIVFMPKSLIEGVMHPTNTIQKAMTCEEFSQSARFNPYSVIGDVWMTFYFWALHTRRIEYMFTFPTHKERTYLKDLLQDKYVTVPVNWTARHVIMTDLETRQSTLLVEKGDRGQYLLYIFAKGVQESHKLEPLDVQLKQTSDNKYIGFMKCKRETVYVMARKTEIPKKSEIQDAAACIGYRGRGGKSYLYQGHEWMPIDEADEDAYWNPEEHSKRQKEDIQRATEGLKMHLKREKIAAQKSVEENKGDDEKSVLMRSE